MRDRQHPSCVLTVTHQVKGEECAARCLEFSDGCCVAQPYEGPRFDHVAIHHDHPPLLEEQEDGTHDLREAMTECARAGCVDGGSVEEPTSAPVGDQPRTVGTRAGISGIRGWHLRRRYNLLYVAVSRAKKTLVLPKAFEEMQARTLTLLRSESTPVG